MGNRAGGASEPRQVALSTSSEHRVEPVHVLQALGVAAADYLAPLCTDTIPNMVIPLSDVVPTKVLHLPFDHRERGEILATVRHKIKAPPQENESGGRGGGVGRSQTLSSSRLVKERTVLASVT